MNLKETEKIKLRHVALLFLLAIGMGIGGFFFVKDVVNREVRQIRHELRKEAQAQIKYINEWRVDQLRNALIASNNSSLAVRSKTWPQGEIQKDIEEKWFYDEIEGIQQDEKYTELRFVDTESIFKASDNHKEQEEHNQPSMQEFLAKVINEKQIMMGPVRWSMHEDGKQHPDICMAAPLMRKVKGADVIGVLLFYIDPNQFLFPSLALWPTQRDSEEIIFFQHTGSEFKVLNDVTNIHAAILSLNVLLGNNEKIQKLIEKEDGFIRSIDYQGEPVIGYIQKVPDSDWMMLIKVNEANVLAHIHAISWNVLIIIILLIVTSNLLLFFWLRQRYLRDQTEQLKLKLQQQVLVQHYDFLSKYANDIIILMDHAGIIVEVNDRAEKAYGWWRDELLGRNIRELSVHSKLSEFEATWHELAKEKSLIFETYHVHKDGRVFPVEVSARMIEIEHQLYVQCIIRDITEKKKAAELIWHQANFDPITELANRRMFMDKLQQEVRRAYRTNMQLVLMLLDLDRFKDVNDTLGHNIGDILLKQAGERLQACVRETDTVARLGGDEFTVILTGMTDFSSVERVAQGILLELARPFLLENQHVHVSASIGITFFPEDATKVDDLMKSADQAMYAAKSQGGNCYEYFTKSMQEAVQTRMRLINDLRNALQRNEFEVLYQPIIDLKTNAICRAEALIRWNHPMLGLINPVDFIPLAEDTGLIHQFGNWVFMEAAKQAAKWQDYVPEFQVSINVSPIQFKNEGIDVALWLERLKSINLSPKAIVIEITEGLLFEIDEKTTGQLLAFRDAGIEVALDDFGTGYSSLSYLKKLDIDYVKIDQMFVRSLMSNEDDRILCEAMTLMAHKLGIRVIAEGVESIDQLELLTSFTCDYAQGYHVSGPITSSRFDELLKNAG